MPGANSFRDTNKVLKTTCATVGRQAVGIQMAAFAVARKHAVVRHQFGKPIASFPLIPEQLVTMLPNAQASMGMRVRLPQMEDEGTYEINTLVAGRAITGITAFV